MSRLLKLLKSTINITLVLTCFSHISSISHNILNPELPVIKEYKQELKNIEFPISFLLCADETGNKNEVYQNYGYKDIYDYFEGYSIFNSSRIGWSGHMKNLNLMCSQN